jgi:hypothetical protein
MRGKTVCCLAVLFLLPAVAAAQGPTKDELQAYMNKLQDIQTDLNARGRSFGELIGPALKNGSDADIAALNRAYRLVVQHVCRLRAGFKAAKAPDHRLATDLHAAFDQLLEHQINSMGDLGNLVDVVEDKGLTAAQKQERILEIIQRSHAAEKAVLARVDAARAALARELAIKMR